MLVCVVADLPRECFSVGTDSRLQSFKEWRGSELSGKSEVRRLLKTVQEVGAEWASVRELIYWVPTVSFHTHAYIASISTFHFHTTLWDEWKAYYFCWWMTWGSRKLSNLQDLDLEAKFVSKVVLSMTIPCLVESREGWLVVILRRGRHRHVYRQKGINPPSSQLHTPILSNFTSSLSLVAELQVSFHHTPVQHVGLRRQREGPMGWECGESKWPQLARVSHALS